MNKRNILIGIIIILALAAFIKKDFVIEKWSGLISGGNQFNEEVLVIVLNTPATDLSSNGLDLNNGIRTANIYEGLVAFDANLKLVPSLAVSWGNIDPNTWEFKLRKDVRFHDRSKFTAENIVESFEKSQEISGSQKTPYLSTIEEINIIDPFNIQIRTKTPDPLLPSKLTKFYIDRPGNIGTGPYKIREWLKGETLSLTAFTDYWASLPTYRNVEYRVIRNRSQRRSNFDEGKIHILVSVPPEQALELPKDQLKTSYSLEVNYLMFKLDDNVLSIREIRDALNSIFDPARIEEIGNGYVRQATQFVAPGVFGYNPDIPPFVYDEAKVPKNIFGDQLARIEFDYLDSYKTLTEYLIKQLNYAGFSVKANAVSPEKLVDRIVNNEPQIYLIGWQSEDGDAGGFLT